MNRPVFSPLRHHHHPQRFQEALARLLTPLTLWICVSVTLKYGYYGNCRMVLGPNSSRLFEASSVFVRQIEVRDEYQKGVFLYGFSERPELSLEKNWSASNYVIVASYSRKVFSLWLNKGSKIRIRWEAQSSSLDQLDVSIIKDKSLNNSMIQTQPSRIFISDLTNAFDSTIGERKYETLVPTSTNSPNAPDALYEPTHGREAEYAIEEDDKYSVAIVNTNPRSIIMEMNVNVSSKMYDTTKAKSACSTTNGSCRLDLGFPNNQFVAVTTPNNGDLGEWYVELSFLARVVTYIAILGFVVIIIFLILKYLGACNGDDSREEVTPIREFTEADHLMPEKPVRLPYGTGDEEDPESGSSSSSEDLYDGKICVICYEEPRNCFFVPCGHCATCYSCAQRIMDGETKVCPICRRLIHKVRKLLIP